MLSVVDRGAEAEVGMSGSGAEVGRSRFEVVSNWSKTSPCIIHGNAGGREELARVTGLLKGVGWLPER